MTGSLQQKKGYYYIVLREQNESGGWATKWISTTLPVRNNKRKAMAMLDEILAENEGRKLNDVILYTNTNSSKVDQCIQGHTESVNLPETLQTTNITEFFMSSFETMALRLRPNTADVYNWTIKRHILPFFESLNKNLEEITPKDIQTYYDTKLKENLSPNTVLKHHAIIHKIFNHAVNLDLIKYNPSDRVILPKREKFIPAVKEPAQVVDILKAAKGTLIEPCVLLAAYYGLRRSEILGLEWSAVDFENNTLTISGTAVKVKQGILYQDKMKTSKSLRTFPLMEVIREYLLELYNHQQEMKRICGSSYIDNNLVCKREDGTPIKLEYVTREFHRVLEKNHLPIIRFHDLRHMAATSLLDMGFSLYEVADWLGHNSIKTTEIYLHSLDKNKKEMAKKMNQYYDNLTS